MKTPLYGMPRPRRARTTLATTALLLAVGLGIVGCTPGDTGTARPTPSPSASVSPTARPTPTATPTSTSASTSSAVPAPSASAPAPQADAPAPQTDGLGDGCPANDARIPDGASTSALADVDGDGEPDMQFYTENPSFAYGVSTASGATYFLADDLAGPGRHSGWSARLESGLVVTVLDDSRTATLHAFVNCAFVNTTAADGSRFDLDLKGFGDQSTGVQCSDGNGGRWLGSVLATRLENGRYNITRTSLDFSADGAVVSNGIVSQIAADVAADDPLVVLAMQSTCGDTPKVATSGM
jgi:hypothetical protein